MFFVFGSWPFVIAALVVYFLIDAFSAIANTPSEPPSTTYDPEDPCDPYDDPIISKRQTKIHDEKPIEVTKEDKTRIDKFFNPVPAPVIPPPIPSSPKKDVLKYISCPKCKEKMKLTKEIVQMLDKENGCTLYCPHCDTIIENIS